MKNAQKMYTIIVFLLSVSCIFGQSPGSLWYFGDHTALNFNEAGPTPVEGHAMYTFEGTAVASDAEGSLMFYTDGTRIWDKNHDIMPNGEGLLGGLSSSQAAVIVQKPLSSTVFYIFTTSSGGMSNALRYSEVDMSLNGGLGDVTLIKNIEILPHSTEQQTVVPHSNGVDFWVVGHALMSNTFQAIKVTAAGVDTTPVSTSIGEIFTEPDDRLGYMQASQFGNMIVLANKRTGLQAAGFNPATGQIIHCQTISRDSGLYGVEISPSGQFVYVSYANGAKVVQYNLFAGSVSLSGITVYEGMTDQYIGGALQRGKDGKIYYTINDRYALSVLENPNGQGPLCNFLEDAIALPSRAYIGLPFSINAKVEKPSIEAKNLCFNDAVSFSVIPSQNITSVNWDFGNGDTSTDIAPSYTYPLSGNYTVTAIVVRDGITETINKPITIVPLPQIQSGQDMFACDGNGNGESDFILSSQTPLILGVLNPSIYTVSYHLTHEDAQSGNNPLPEIYKNIQNPQTIYVRVVNTSGCYAETSFRLIVHPKPVIDMEEEFFICKESGRVTLTAPPGFDMYLWSTGESSRSIVLETEGAYKLAVYKKYGDIHCVGEKDIIVSISQKPQIRMIEVDDWKSSNNSITVFTVLAGDYDYSLNGIHYQVDNTFTGLAPGIYNVYVKNSCGSDTDRVAILMYPKFFTPNGDGKNETWQIDFAHFEPLLRVNIYDRYGKLLSSFKGGDGGWDGMLSGSKLPATDYWFEVERENGKIFKGHFSLLR